ncbi:MAG: hypothetical protein DRP30_03425 [Thermotoga sp.]|nr:MAG: hypothetical protein DRP30_03425 [Thermotoga sp.]
MVDMWRFSILFLIFLSVLTLSFSELIYITLEATGLDEESLKQRMGITALKKFIKENLDIKSAQKDIVMKYFVAFKPLGYIKDVEISELKKKDGYIWGKGTVTISYGETYTGIRELLYDLGNPKVFVRTKVEVKLINLTQPATNLERKMKLGVDEMLSSMVISKLREDGFTITDDPRKSDITVDLYSEVDLSYYKFKGIFSEINEGFSVTILTKAKLLDTQSLNVIFAVQETSAPGDVGSNPLFTTSYLLPDLVDKIYNSIYPKMMNYIFSEYRREKFMKFIGVSEEELRKILDELRGKLPALVDIKERKYGQENGEKFVEYEIIYFGSMTKLLDILSEKYETSIDNGEISIKPIIYTIILKKCSAKKIKVVLDFLKNSRIDYEIKKFYKDTLTVSIKGIEDFFNLCLDISNSLKLNLLEFSDRKAVLEF